MTERYAVATGNWSAVSTWDGGVSLPASGDDVYANNKTVTIDQDITVVALHTNAGVTAVAGGNFTVPNTMTSGTRAINANIIAGTTTCLSIAHIGGTVNGSGSATGGSSSAAAAISILASGTTNWTGNCTGGSGATAYGLISGLSLPLVGSLGTVTVTGNALGGSNTAIGVVNNSHGILNLIGDATGGTAANASGCQNAGIGTLNQTGNAYGSATVGATGAVNNATGTYNLTGNATGGAGTSAVGAINNGQGPFNLYGVATGGAGGSSYGFNSSSTILGFVYLQTVRANNYPNDSLTNAVAGFNAGNAGSSVLIRSFEFGTGGGNPINGSANVRVFMKAGSGTTKVYESNAGSTFTMNEVTGDYPAEANVRKGTSYAFANKTGTMNVPPSGAVAKGVSVDNTTGLAFLKQSHISDALGPVLAGFGS